MAWWRERLRRAAAGPWVPAAACALCGWALAADLFAREASSVLLAGLSLGLLVLAVTRATGLPGEAAPPGRRAVSAAAFGVLLLSLLPYRAFVLAGGPGAAVALALLAAALWLLAAGREGVGGVVLGPAVALRPELVLVAVWLLACRRFRAATALAGSAVATCAVLLLATGLGPWKAFWAAQAAGFPGGGGVGSGPAALDNLSLWACGARLWPGPAVGPVVIAVVLVVLLAVVVRAAHRASPEQTRALLLPFLALAVLAMPVARRPMVWLLLPGALLALHHAWTTLPAGRRERFVVVLSAVLLLAGFDLLPRYASVFAPPWAAGALFSLNSYALLAVLGLGLQLARAEPAASEARAPASPGATALELARAALPALALGFVLLWAAVAVLRVLYPFELEWMEGTTVEHVVRVLQGRALYVEPSLEFVPYVYTPLYVWLGALVSWPFGAGFAPLRLLSAACAAGCMLLLGRTAQRETGRASWGLVAAGLFAATYRVSGTWFDLARVDSLFLLLVLATFYVLRFHRSTRGLVLAGLLGGLAFLAKQTALLALAPLVVHEAWRGLRRSLWLVVPLVGLVGLSTVALDAAHDGWYAYYVFDLPARHPLVPRMWVEFWRSDLLGPLALAGALGLVWFVFAATDESRERFWFHLASAAGLLAVSWSGRLHDGGHPNVLMPACAAVALCGALGAHRLLESARRDPASRRAPWLGLAVLAVCAAQLAVLDYPLARQVPTPTDERAGRALVERIRGFAGEVWMPSHGFWTTLAGKPPFVHRMAADDIVRSGDRARSVRLEKEIRAALAARRFAAVIVSDSYFRLELERTYRLVGPAVAGDGVLVPRAGEPFRPGELFVPR
ncbi:MAG: DUF2029 domain-containing protein [Deltaproteobacteria bacterium]|nr:DUF2029 domain-containing protein [Deltaproteobacteria bacterium]